MTTILLMPPQEDPSSRTIDGRWPEIDPESGIESGGATKYILITQDLESILTQVVPLIASP